jgi:hypothetical protein
MTAPHRKPEEIAEDDEPGGVDPPYEAGWMEWVAVPLLLIGGILIPFLGWFVGVVLLWSSRVWSLRDKVWGTLLLPGGFLPAFGLLFGGIAEETCTGGTGDPVRCTDSFSTSGRIALAMLLVVFIVAPVVTAIRLGRKLKRS